MVHTEYGTPHVLHLKEVVRPALQASEVLVEVRAASLNYGDAALVRGKPFLVHLMGRGLFRPKLETGAVVPAIGKRYLPSEVAQAMRHLEEGRRQGKIVITIPRDK